MVHLKDVNQLTGRIVRATPQSFLDETALNEERDNGSLASECLWLCGSGEAIITPWMVLERCHANADEGGVLLEMKRDCLEKAEQFCNLLYEYHREDKFDFKKAVPKWMHQETKAKNGTKIRKFDLYFRVL